MKRFAATKQNSTKPSSYPFQYVTHSKFEIA